MYSGIFRHLDQKNKRNKTMDKNEAVKIANIYVKTIKSKYDLKINIVWFNCK